MAEFSIAISIARKKINLTEIYLGVVNFLKKTGSNLSIFNLKEKKINNIYPDQNKTGPVGVGFTFKGKNFITHTHLSHEVTAINTLIAWQKYFLLTLVLLLVASFVLIPKITAIILIAILSVAYFADLLFSVHVVRKSISKSPEIKINEIELAQIKEQDLPIYTILCPLYKEASVLPGFVEAIKNVNWPKDKLDIVLLLEEDDLETIGVANNLNLPHYFRTLVIPHSLPKTKPKACNYGLAHAYGEFMVIYDAEDRPDPQQLKKVYLAFNKLGSKVVCLQCKLNYYNPTHNLLTKLFTVEYTLWFDLILPGLQSLSTTIPLGGTSNHFRVKALRYLEGWDPFNVTEDCDLGTRIFKNRLQTAIVDSTTLEEANSNYRGWVKQRSRWLKGYLQTYLVHMRDPIEFYKRHGKHAFIFQLITGIRICFTLVNPIMWATTASYFAFRATIGETIESLYPMPVFYIASLTTVFGNFFYMYLYMIACAKNGYWWLMKYIFLIPLYWLSASFAASIAFYQLITNPHYWAKTAHGLNLANNNLPAESKVTSGIPLAIVNFDRFDDMIKILATPYPNSWYYNYSFSKGFYTFLLTIFAGISELRYLVFFVWTSVFITTFFVLTKIPL